MALETWKENQLQERQQKERRKEEEEEERESNLNLQQSCYKKINLKIGMEFRKASPSSKTLSSRLKKK